jgi:hypothetical protein
MVGKAAGKPESADELAASAIVRAVTEGDTRRLDPGGGRTQLADYVLVGNDGRDVGLLEVTSITDKRYEAFWSAKTGKSRSWRDARLRRLWVVSLQHTGVRLERLRAITTPVLIDLEHVGVTFACADPRSYRGTVAILGDELREAGVVELHGLPEPRAGEGGAVINVMPWGGAYGIETLTAAIEAVARKEDNLTKLRGEVERRELFVWLNPPSGALTALTTFCDEPFRGQVALARPPALPEEITTVWAAAWPRDPKTALALALWRADGTGWSVLDPPSPPA